jgi:hypothetical protein
MTVAGVPLEQPLMGLFRSALRKPFMAIFHAHIDESGKHHQHEIVSFVAMCAADDRLAEFNDAWRAILRRYGLDTLHMVKVTKTKKFSPNVPAPSTAERIEALKSFADCINTKLEAGFGMAIDVPAFRNLSKGMRAGLGNHEDPYHVAFIRVLLEIAGYVHEDNKISLLTDYDMETGWETFRSYKGMRHTYPELRKKTIALSYVGDEHFPAVQAADMVAYLVRLEAKWLFHRIPYDYKPLLDHLIDRRPAFSTLKWGICLANKAVMETLKTKEDILAELKNKGKL